MGINHLYHSLLQQVMNIEINEIRINEDWLLLRSRMAVLNSTTWTANVLATFENVYTIFLRPYQSVTQTFR